MDSTLNYSMSSVKQPCHIYLFIYSTLENKVYKENFYAQSHSDELFDVWKIYKGLFLSLGVYNLIVNQKYMHY